MAFNIGTEWVSPLVAGIFLVIVAIITQVATRRNAAKGAKEQRVPSVDELWEAQDSDRRIRQIIESMFWDIREGWKTYFRRVQRVTETVEMSDEQRSRLGLTDTEHELIKLVPPKDGE